MNALHEMLPWYVNGTLDPEETATFREHLEECRACREEMTFLDQLKREVKNHGDALLGEHPAAEHLVALYAPETGVAAVTGEEASAIGRHLALCSTCAEEARWIRGEEIAADAAGAAGASAAAAPHPTRQRLALWPWGLAAAAFLGGLILTPLLMPTPRSGSGVSSMSVVPPTQRAAGAIPEIEFPSDGGSAHLLLPVSAGSGELPLWIEVRDTAGEVRLRQEGIGAGALVSGSYLFLICAPDDFPVGRYTARIGSPSGVAATEYPFSLIPPR